MTAQAVLDESRGTRSLHFNALKSAYAPPFSTVSISSRIDEVHWLGGFMERVSTSRLQWLEMITQLIITSIVPRSRGHYSSLCTYTAPTLPWPVYSSEQVARHLAVYCLVNERTPKISIEKSLVNLSATASASLLPRRCRRVQHLQHLLTAHADYKGAS